MSAAVPLREDFDADALRRLARASRDAGQSRRLLALATVYDGGSRTDAARIGVVGLQRACRKVDEVYGSLAIPAELAVSDPEPADDPQCPRAQAEAPSPRRLQGPAF